MVTNLMGKCCAALLILTISLVTAASTVAEEKAPPGPPPFVNGIPFPKFIETNGYRDSLRKSIVKFERDFGACTLAMVSARRTVVVPKKPVNFPDHGQVPQWIEVMDMKGCGKAFLRGVLVAQLGDSFKFFPLVHGSGISGVLEQWDVIETLIPAQKSIAEKAGCGKEDKVKILAHDLIGKKTEETGRAWKEAWKLETCKGPKTVKIAFRKDASGATTFQILDDSR